MIKKFETVIHDARKTIEHYMECDGFEPVWHNDDWETALRKIANYIVNIKINTEYRAREADPGDEI